MEVGDNSYSALQSSLTHSIYCTALSSDVISFLSEKVGKNFNFNFDVMSFLPEKVGKNQRYYQTFTEAHVSDSVKVQMPLNNRRFSREVQPWHVVSVQCIPYKRGYRTRPHLQSCEFSSSRAEDDFKILIIYIDSQYKYVFSGVFGGGLLPLSLQVRS